MGELIYSQNISNSVCNKLFETALFEGVEFPKGKLYEDEYVTYILFHRCKAVSVRTDVLYYYRSNPDSITHAKFSDRELDRIYASLEKLSFAKPSTLNIGIVRFVTWFTIAFVHSKRWRAMTSGMMV